jgi:hypothetical protein
MYRFHHQSEKNQQDRKTLAIISNRNTLLLFFQSGLQLLVTAYVVPSSLNFFALMMEATIFSETSVLTRATRRHILADGILNGNAMLFTVYLDFVLMPSREGNKRMKFFFCGQLLTILHSLPSNWPSAPLPHITAGSRWYHNLSLPVQKSALSKIVFPKSECYQK